MGDRGSGRPPVRASTEDDEGDAEGPPLTERESQVLRAMAQGLSNAEIGTAVHLSEATVKTHVTSILTKLNVRDRLQAVIAAYESGAVRPGMRDQP